MRTESRHREMIKDAAVGGLSILPRCDETALRARPIRGGRVELRFAGILRKPISSWRPLRSPGMKTDTNVYASRNANELPGIHEAANRADIEDERCMIHCRITDERHSCGKVSTYIVEPASQPAR